MWIAPLPRLCSSRHFPVLDCKLFADASLDWRWAKAWLSLLACIAMNTKVVPWRAAQQKEINQTDTNTRNLSARPTSSFTQLGNAKISFSNEEMARGLIAQLVSAYG